MDWSFVDCGWIGVWWNQGLSKRGYKNPTSSKAVDNGKISDTILSNGLRS
jgi:hypothetical protein